MHTKITRTPFPASQKIYVKGSMHNIEVAMREITLSDTRLHGRNGGTEPNAPVTLYDASGPYTDPAIAIDLTKGLPRLRQPWITGRGDVQQLDGLSSAYGRALLADPALDHLRFEYYQMPLKANPGNNVSQLHYARKGIITPEMEYISIRENQRAEEQFRAGNSLWQQHRGTGRHTAFITPEFVRKEVAEGHAII